MNFDQLKEQWNKENSDVNIPSTIEQLKESKHPIEKIQKNMKKEFIMQVIAIILIAFFPQNLSSGFTIYHLLSSYAMLVVISSYFSDFINFTSKPNFIQEIQKTALENLP
jgi:hypothetical protein